MFYLSLFVIELIALFYVSRSLQKKLGSFLFRVTRNKKISVYIMAILFLPGTVIHELSHFLTGLFLLVPVGEIEFIPELSEDTVKLGSAEIGKTDPIRRFLIGVAPLVVGTCLILSVVYYFSQNLIVSENVWLARSLVGVIVFEVANTMFLSKKDLEGSWRIYLLLIFLFFVLYFLGINLSAEAVNWLTDSKLNLIFATAAFFMAIPVVIDFVIIGLLKFFNK